jgi:hypothetical protein
MALSRGTIHKITPPPRAVLKSANPSVGVVRIGKQAKSGPRKGMRPKGTINATRGL